MPSVDRPVRTTPIVAAGPAKVQRPCVFSCSGGNFLRSSAAGSAPPATVLTKAMSNDRHGHPVRPASAGGDSVLHARPPRQQHPDRPVQLHRAGEWRHQQHRVSVSTISNTSQFRTVDGPDQQPLPAPGPIAIALTNPRLLSELSRLQRTGAGLVRPADSGTVPDPSAPSGGMGGPVVTNSPPARIGSPYAGDLLAEVQRVRRPGRGRSPAARASTSSTPTTG